MGELGDRIQRVRDEESAMAASHRRQVEAQQLSYRRSQEFIDLMRCKEIGATSLINIITHQVTRRKGLFDATRESTGRVTHEYTPVGAGWILTEVAGEYERTPTNWMILESNRTVMCSPLIEATTLENPPELPFAALSGDNLEAATIPSPFAQDRQFAWLAEAAIRLGGE